ncbi:hypothetical protein F5144DRAFT_553089 [Chaetomium tenue]|uniref:Uncharacterized protein n=1 Tax=Chaetomium tenue TaxID=1854479 RepID=A0ACB7PK59_9PEZI|nr:hypothetical protein F5144DRAFT_553089 [Chaetomium globosum]
MSDNRKDSHKATAVRSQQITGNDERSSHSIQAMADSIQVATEECKGRETEGSGSFSRVMRVGEHRVLVLSPTEVVRIANGLLLMVGQHSKKTLGRITLQFPGLQVAALGERVNISSVYTSMSWDHESQITGDERREYNCGRVLRFVLGYYWALAHFSMAWASVQVLDPNILFAEWQGNGRRYARMREFIKAVPVVQCTEGAWLEDETVVAEGRRLISQMSCLASDGA